MASRNAARLARLVDELLDMERIAAGKLDINRATESSNAMVAAAMDAVLGVADLAGFTLESDLGDDVLVSADAQRIEQVLIDLTTNAVKYAASGGRAVIRTLPRDGAVRFEVADHGPGMEADEFTKALHWFTQLDASDRRSQGGTGLGLSITRSLLEPHDTSLNLRETPGGGCTFWFDLDTAE